MADKQISFELDFTTGPHGLSVVPGIESLHETLQENVVPELNEKGGIPGEEGAVVLLFFTLSHAVIEQRSIDLLYHNIIDKQFKSNKTREFLRNYLNQNQREDLLLRTGTIPGHIHSYMPTARKARNSIVHDPHGHFLPDFNNNLSETAEETMEAVIRLEEMVVDQSLPDDLK